MLSYCSQLEELSLCGIVSKSERERKKQSERAVKSVRERRRVKESERE
jgi:hypothetical protein